MKIDPFVYPGNPIFAITIIVGVTLAVASIVISVIWMKRYVARNPDPAKRTEDPSSFVVIGVAIAFMLILFFPLTGRMVSDGQENKARIAHYSAEVAKVAEAYPQLKEAGIKLDYSGYSSSELDGDLTRVISNQGEFTPFGTSYERTDAGLDRSNLVAILNDDGTLELFVADEAQELVKLEPQKG